jgi:magnesium chelatase subunit I
MEKPNTLGKLNESGYIRKTIKQEMRDNCIRMLENGETLLPGIIGYDKTVVPGLVNAILSQHDFILLGLRGQAKSRILRSLVRFLDEYIPVLEGTEILDDPIVPITREGKDTVREMGDNAPVRWARRQERYNEKLATPDITIADLIGDIDPIRAAREKRNLSDEQIINFGIVPRSNRGIFALNELPDLPSRIQVGLLNIMEEKDIQIRGFPLRLPLDLCMVYTANPEDYTNRGSIISPLKDRIDSQIITHYPETIDESILITEQESWTERNGAITVSMPDVIRELVEEVAFAARKSEFVDQKSGVSARMSISLMENIISNMERRAILNGEGNAHPRIGDLHMALTAITGKVELVYEGEKEGPDMVAKKLIGDAVRTVFGRHFPVPKHSGKEEDKSDALYKNILKWFASGNTLKLSDDLPASEYSKRLSMVTDAEKIANHYFKEGQAGSDGLGAELLLDGLHQHSMISKRNDGSASSYRDMLTTMFGKFTT